MRIHVPANLADKNIILNNKGVSTVVIQGKEFKRVPYECMSNQGVKPSSVKDGSDDFVDVYGEDAGQLPAGQVFQLSSVQEDIGGGLMVSQLTPVEFIRNPGV